MSTLSELLGYVCALLAIAIAIATGFKVLTKSPVADLPSRASASRVNQHYLDDVRDQSCYRFLRGLHGLVTGLLIAVFLLLWLVLAANARDGAAGFFYAMVCGVCVAVVVIERGLFSLAVDAADVLVDMGRRKRDRVASECDEADGEQMSAAALIRDAAAWRTLREAGKPRPSSDQAGSLES